jgi:hypothetical protein
MKYGHCPYSKERKTSGKVYPKFECTCFRNSIFATLHISHALKVVYHIYKPNTADRTQCSVKHYVMKMCGGGERSKALGVLTSALVGGEWSDSRPGRFTPGEEPPVPI